MRPAYAVIKKIAVGACRAAFRFRRMGRGCLSPTPGTTRISVIDTRTLAVTATWPVGAEPSSVVEDRAGKHLFVANRISQ